MRLTSHITTNEKLLKSISEVRVPHDQKTPSLSIDQGYAVDILNQDVFSEPIESEYDVNCYTITFDRQEYSPLFGKNTQFTHTMHSIITNLIKTQCFVTFKHPLVTAQLLIGSGDILTTAFVQPSSISHCDSLFYKRNMVRFSLPGKAIKCAAQACSCALCTVFQLGISRYVILFNIISCSYIANYILVIFLGVRTHRL